MGKKQEKKIKSLPESLGELNQSMWRLADVIEAANIPELTKVLREGFEWLKREGILMRTTEPPLMQRATPATTKGEKK